MGKIRYNYETKGDDYREFFSNIYFRRGITEKTTLGFNAAYSSDISNLGLLWTQALSKYALLDMTAIGSDNHSESGYSVATSRKSCNPTNRGSDGYRSGMGGTPPSLRAFSHNSCCPTRYSSTVISPDQTSSMSCQSCVSASAGQKVQLV